MRFSTFKQFFATPFFFAFLSIGLFLGFGSHHLTQFITADEHYWLYERIPQYWNAWSDLNLKKTYINDKPGVTIALVSGVGLLLEPHPETLCSQTPDKIITCDTSRTEEVLFAFRFPILLINALLFVYLFWIIRKVSTDWIAAWSIIFISLSPILIGISQIINPDALLWSLGASAFFSYIALLLFPEKKYLVFSGVFLGLAILSKYTASILIPFFLLVTVGIHPTLQSIRTSPEDALLQTRARLKRFLSVTGIAIGLMIILLPAIVFRPAILVNLLSGGSQEPLILVSAIASILLIADNVFLRGEVLRWFALGIRKIFSYRLAQYMLPWSIFLLFFSLLLGRFLFPDWSLFERIPFDLKDITSDIKLYGPSPTPIESLLLEANPIVFSLVPVALFFFLFGVLRMRSRIFREAPLSISHIPLLATIIFIPFFLVMLSFMGVLATPRYLILLFPLVAFVAAIGVSECCYLLKSLKFSVFRFHFQTKTFFSALIIFISLISLSKSLPFFFNYTNSFLPKTEMISDSWGYGGYEAAQYLNTLPHVEHLLVWSDYEGLCEFFKGQCITKKYRLTWEQPIDYALITHRGEILYNPNHIRWLNKENVYIRPAYDDPNPEWSLTINERPENFVKLIKMQPDPRP